MQGGSSKRGSWKQRHGGTGGQRPSKFPIKHDVDVFQMAKIMRGGEGDAVKGICVGGCNRLSKVCGGCNEQRAGLTGRCWGRGSTELDGRLEVSHCLEHVLFQI